MANYFKNFPTTYYKQFSSLDRNKSFEIVTDITKRFTVNQALVENSTAYLKFVISDGDTPEIIAHKYYGDTEKHWIVLAMNNIIDPQWDWPLNTNALDSFVNEKYTANASVGQTGLEWAKTTIHSYYKIEKQRVIERGIYNEKKVQVDEDTYNLVYVTSTGYQLQDGTNLVVDTEKETITFYDYEVQTNDSKREIKLLKNEFVPMLNDELQNVFTNEDF
jgi:hypothetical protein